MVYWVWRILQPSHGGESLYILLKIFLMKNFAVYVLPIHHCLFKKPGVDAAALQEVASHPQALRQTINTRKEKFPDLKELEIEDTAIGAEWLAKGILPETTAAICSARAGNCGIWR